MNHFIWGDWRSDEELEEIAQEMNSIGRRIELKTKPIREWVEEIEAYRRTHGKVF